MASEGDSFLNEVYSSKYISDGDFRSLVNRTRGWVATAKSPAKLTLNSEQSSQFMRCVALSSMQALPLCVELSDLLIHPRKQVRLNLRLECMQQLEAIEAAGDLQFNTLTLPYGMGSLYLGEHEVFRLGASTQQFRARINAVLANRPRQHLIVNISRYEFPRFTPIYASVRGVNLNLRGGWGAEFMTNVPLFANLIEGLKIHPGNFANLEPLRALRKLRTLSIGGVVAGRIDVLGDLPELKNLQLINLNEVQDFSALRKLQKLVTVDIQDARGFTDLSCLLSSANTLTKISVSNAGVSDTSMLHAFTKLHTLRLIRNPVHELLSLPSRVRTLDLSGTLVSDLSLLRDFSELENISLCSMSRLVRTEALGECPALQTVSV